MSKIPVLKALTHLPYALPSGRVVSQVGYDPETMVYSDFDHDAFPAIPDNPTPDEMRQALSTVWRPWSGYRFATPDDTAAMLSAITTAVVRPALGICPGFFLMHLFKLRAKRKRLGLWAR